MAKRKQENQTPPKGIIPYEIVKNGVVWKCESVDIANDMFEFRSSKGEVFVRKWNELQRILTK